MSIVDTIYRHCLSGPFQGDLTAQNISLYHTSPFTIYCEKFVSAKEKDPLSPYRELLLKRGLEHERSVIERKYPECLPIDCEAPEAGFRTILEEMARGTDVICGLPLFYLPENMQGRIDILERRNDGSSVFGNYYYIVTEIKLVKKIRPEHILQAAFYTYMLSKIQEYMPHIFRLINHDFRVFEYSFAEHEGELHSALRGTRAILDGREAPTATYNASEWPWEKYGNHEAIRMRDVSLVGQVGPKTKQKLIDRGFKKIWDVAYAKVDELLKIPGIHETTAKKLIVSAQAIMKNEPLCIDSSALQFPAKPTEIFLDLEGTDQPDMEGGIEPVDYLIGVVVCKDGVDTYHSFIAHKMRDEEKMFREFLLFLSAQKDYIIYHWHNYEHWHIKRLAERYHFIEEAEALILPFMVDLHRMATKAFAFPTYTNGLKDVAAFLGFRWRHDDMNALDAIAYYLKYQTEPDTYRNKIQAIIDYNEDDCRATKRIKDWLQERIHPRT